MSDVLIPEYQPCQFDMGWSGTCKKPTTNGWCSKHEAVKCVSCGNKAVRSCDEAGSLVCGANLCRDCVHSPSGSGHVTRLVAVEILRAEEIEREAAKISRTSPAQRLDEKLGVPLNLLELLKGGRQGYEIKECYHLELVHTLMGYFPAIFKGSERIVVSIDTELMKKVWMTMTPRRSKMGTNLGYVNVELGFAYPIYGDSVYDQESSLPEQLLTRIEFDELMVSSGHPFEWQPGLVGSGMTPEEFVSTIETVAKKYDIRIQPGA